MQPPQVIQRVFPSRLRKGVRDMVKAALPKQLAPGVCRVSPRLMDEEYTCGRWEYLNDLEEMARYAVIAGYCRHIGDISSVLDLGCGIGLLRAWLRPAEVIDYVGVDFSTVAIEMARIRWTDESTKFIATDIATFVPDRKFDVIVLNEVLYYFERPDWILRRVAAFLKENGRLVISLWESPESRLAWRRSRNSVHILDEVQVRHRSGLSWEIRLCRPRLVAT
ncbi:class I SAM-dependent methyltransferase [Bradyrhizobium huanghuaihaiense]|uniref:class I SAM-dependent methyltransferase n=1 Tax=Bradyrhizobium huanghuaihaiense TaxID=990078 RepID=UPI0021AAD31F|nr:class I SAM-dependent methyltransferase [Bradyrhizobium sp. CB3035]UWU74819.1 class I SAM-dependent methyltransferase [Bradyrhizobium sp. CB3035]